MEIHLLNTFAQTHGLTTENPVTLRPGKIPHFERTCRELGIHIPRRMRQQGPSLRSCQLADPLAIDSLLWGPRGRSSGSSAPRRRCPGPARATLRARPLAAPSSRIITPHSLHMQLSSTSATREINPRHTPKNSGHRNRQPCVRARFLISSTPTRKSAVLLLAHSRQYRQLLLSFQLADLLTALGSAAAEVRAAALLAAAATPRHGFSWHRPRTG